MIKNAISKYVLLIFILAILNSGMVIAADKDNFKGINFGKDIDQESWVLSEGVKGQINDGKLNLELEKSYANITVNKLEVFAPAYKFFKIKMKNNTSQHSLKMYWKEKEEEEWGAERSISIDVNPYEDTYTEYWVNLGEVNTWDNVVRQIRLDYNNDNQIDGQGAVQSISIESLEFVNSIADKTPLTDEEMFGIWKDDKWDLQGKINYNYKESLESIEEDVKKGEYQAAKDKIRFYFNIDKIQDELKLSEVNEKIADLIQNNIILIEEDINTYLGKYSLVQDDFKYIDILDLVKREQQLDKKVVLMLMCPGTYEYVKLNTSQNKRGPEISIKIADQQFKLEPVWEASLDIKTLEGNKNKKDFEYIMQEGNLKDNSTYKEKRILLTFDLSKIPQGNIDEAKLYVHGTGYGGYTGKRSVMDPFTGDRYHISDKGDYIAGTFYMFNMPSDRLDDTYNQIIVKDLTAYYWGAESDDIDWKYEPYSQHMLNFWFLDSLIAQYKKENSAKYADPMIKIMQSFVYQIGGTTPLYPTITEADARIRRCIYAYRMLLGSNSLDSNANMLMLEYMWKAGHQLEREIEMNACSPDQEIVSKNLLNTIAENFPQFIDSEKWKLIANGDKTPVNPEQESLTETSKIGDAVAVCVDQPKAYVGKKIVDIDETNKAVTPIVKNNRTLVPIRFISEAFGASVQWDEDTSTATIIVNNKAVKIQLNSNKMEIDGGEVLLDTPAESINERIYIPLRKLTEEVLGKKVFYENGLIVISDIENILNKDDDMKFIEKMVDMLR